MAVSPTNSGGGADGNVDTAAVGEKVLASGSLTSNTVGSGASRSCSPFQGPDGYPTGTYDPTAAASDRNGTSSATASIEVATL